MKTKKVYADMITRGSDYDHIVALFRQKAAVRLVEQAYFRNKKDPTAPKQPMPFLTEPVDDNGFNQRLVSCIKDERYDLIDYQQTDFIRYLFGALRTEHINEKQFLTTMIMFQSLSCFNGGVLPESPQQRFTRYNLNDPNGAYQLKNAIDYWGKDEFNELNKRYQASSSMENKLHYYTINLQHYQLVGLLYFMAISDQMAPPEQELKQLITLLEKYIDASNAAYDVKKRVLPQLAECLSRGKNRLSSHHLLAVFGELNPAIRPYLDVVDEYIFNRTAFKARTTFPKHAFRALGLFIEDKALLEKEFGTISFLGALTDGYSNLPKLCLSPQYDASHENSPVASFVLPTIETLDTLMDILFSHNKQSIEGVAGYFPPRLIRAYDELPNVAESERTPVQKTLACTYPRAIQLKSSTRPIQVLHPDIENTARPHEYNCHDLMFAWHDNYHAWKASTILKAMFRKLRTLHDDKATYADPAARAGMSKGIWELTDFNIDKPERFLSRQKKMTEQGQIDKNRGVINRVILTLILKTSYFFDEQDTPNSEFKENIYLFLYDLYKNPGDWRLLLDDYDAAMLLDPIAAVSAPAFALENDSFKTIVRSAASLFSYLQTHPSANIIEVIFNNLLLKQPADNAGKSDSNQTINQVLLTGLRSIDMHDVVYWSKNEGLYFTKKWVNALGVNKKLTRNTPEVLQEAIYRIIINHQQSALGFFSPVTSSPKNWTLQTLLVDNKVFAPDEILHKAPEQQDYELLIRRLAAAAKRHDLNTVLSFLQSAEIVVDVHARNSKNQNAIDLIESFRKSMPRNAPAYDQCEKLLNDYASSMKNAHNIKN